MSNQTKLGFQHQKPGTRRIVQRKPAAQAEGKDNADTTSIVAQTDTATLLSSRQSMEDRLKAFLERKKETKEAASRIQRPSTRNAAMLKRKITQARDEKQLSSPSTSSDNLLASTTATSKEKSSPPTPTTSRDKVSETWSQTEETSGQEEKIHEPEEKENAKQPQENSTTSGVEDETSDTEHSIAQKTADLQEVSELHHLATPPASSPIAPLSDEDDEDIHVVARKSVRARPLYIAEESLNVPTEAKMSATVSTTRPRSTRSAALQARLARISATFSTASQGNLDDIRGTSKTTTVITSSSSSITTTTSTTTIATGSTAALPLPKSLDTLFKLFRGLDHIVRFHQHQGQQCFYHKVKRQVERVASQNFEIRHLAQIKTLYPEAFEYSVAPCLHEGKKIRSYLIELKTEKKASGEDEGDGSDRQSDNKAQEGGITVSNTRFIPLENQRRDTFRERLVQYVQKHHNAFLQSTVPPRTDPFPLSWHVKFDLESVPEVDRAQLPELQPRVIASDPNFELQSLGTKTTTSRLVLSSSPLSSSSSGTSNSIVVPPEPQPEGNKHQDKGTLEKKSQGSSISHGPSAVSTSVTANATVAASSGSADVGAKKGSTTASTDEKDDMIPVPKLLSRLEQMKEKLRLKQLEKQQATQGQVSKADKSLALQRSRLPAIFDMIKFLRFKVMPVSTLAEKIAYSHKWPLSEVEARQHLHLLASELPDWCQIFAAGSTGDHFKVIETDPVKEKQFRARLVQLALTLSS
ncbi:hypothetical protein BGW42_001974 [Actinomortierella wolfii]|nr:hypothetical protein BGW42_001974 [Actinomortierella wolfii]